MREISDDADVHYDSKVLIAPGDKAAKDRLAQLPVFVPAAELDKAKQEAAAAQAAQAATLKSEQTKEESYRSQYPGSLHFDYVWDEKKGKELGLQQIWRDDKFTYEERQVSVKSFKTDPDCRVLVATPASAKEGLTLTSANNAIFYDRSFSLDDYLQAQDRIHRISQTKECYVTNLLAADSIDQWVNLLLNAKHLAAQLAQGDISQSQYHESAAHDFKVKVRKTDLDRIQSSARVAIERLIFVIGTSAPTT